MAEIGEGESVEVKGSGAKPYVLRNSGGVYSCSCPAWRNQSSPIEKRTCKHLKRIRGDAAELARIGSAGNRVGTRVSSQPSKRDQEANVLLASNWEPHIDPTGWWMSEKLDGVRALWDGKRFLSRQGNEFLAPDWFVQSLPETRLDGELWIGRGQFQETVSVVRSRSRSEEWRWVQFLVFDAPLHDGVWETRMKFLKQTLPKVGKTQKIVALLSQTKCKGTEHVWAELSRVENEGGEGLMLRQPGSKYELGRSETLLKVKRFLDAEARVVGYQPGKGKHAGKLGALLVELEDGTKFSLGTGFTDKQREAPPALGSFVTFHYQELSKAGVPRFPSFLRIADFPVAKKKSRR